LGQVCANWRPRLPPNRRWQCVKEMISYARDHSVADGLNYVATWNVAMLLGNDLQEAMMANMGKRAPGFKD
ncbi:MAG: hypothetical protein ACOYNF_15510, partial [Rhodoferax sp.]